MFPNIVLRKYALSSIVGTDQHLPGNSYAYLTIYSLYSSLFLLNYNIELLYGYFKVLILNIVSKQKSVPRQIF